MNVLSLFDGMSVAQQALKELNIKVDTYYASEIDKYSIAVTQSNFPNTIQLGDVVGLKLNEDIDLMIGGSPCQDLSIAKKNREGLKGQRSGLFYEYVRIRDEVKPKYFILENVNSMPKEAKEQISEILGVQPIMINASLVSAQNRKRLFWVGKWNGEKYEQVEMSLPEDKGILLKDILEENVDEKYYINPKNIVSQSERFIQWDASGKGYNSQQDRAYTELGKSPTVPFHGASSKMNVILNKNETEKLKSNSMVAIKSNYNNTLKYDKTNTLGSNSQCPTAKTGQELLDFEKQTIRKLTPIETLRLQSMPDNYFDNATTTRGKSNKKHPISNTQRYKMCGNAFNCEVVKHIINNLK